MSGLAHRLRKANADKLEFERRLNEEAEKKRRMYSAFQTKKASAKSSQSNYLPMDQIEPFQRLRSHTLPPDETSTNDRKTNPHSRDAWAARKPRPRSPALTRLKGIHQPKQQVLKSTAKRGRRVSAMGRYWGHQSEAITPKSQVSLPTPKSLPSLKRHEAIRIRQIASDQMNGKPRRSFYALRGNEIDWGLDPRYKRTFSIESMPKPRPTNQRSLYLKRPW